MEIDEIFQQHIFGMCSIMKAGEPLSAVGKSTPSNSYAALSEAGNWETEVKNETFGSLRLPRSH